MNKNVPVFEQWPFKVPNIQKGVALDEELTAALRNAKDEKEALAIVKKHNKAMDKFSNEATHVEVLYSLETTNAKYEKAMNILNEGMPLIQNAETNFQKAMVESPFRPYLEQKLGSFLFQMYEYSLRSFDEKIIPEATEENMLSMKYSATVASIRVEFDGQTYNLPQMGKFLQDNDRDVRRRASKAYFSALTEKAEELEEIYDKLVHIRHTMAQKLGFKNYVDLAYLRMGRYDYNPQDVAFYRDEIARVVTPLAGKLLKDQFKRTKIRDPHIYDLSLSFLDGNPMPKGTTEEKIAIAQKMYDQMSEETSRYFRFMVDHHVLDLEARPGKQSGGYMTFFPVYGTSFIFSNFNGTSGDVDVLTHEFGHSFQGFLGAKIPVPEYRCGTMDAAEIDSMSMEFFAHPYMEGFFDNAERYRFTHLADAISFLPYGVTVDEFQHWDYENPAATPAERDAKWHELELKFTPYKVAVYKDCEYMNQGRRWLTQGHIFGSPFYYIDYTLAQVMAFQFFNLDRKNHELAWKRYIALCKMGGKYPFRSLVTKAHMKDPFLPGTMEKSIKPLIKELKSYKID